MIALSGSFALTAAHAQEYPNKPIKIVVPFAAGGAVDSIARVVGQRLSVQVGQPVLIDNRSGASANLAADLVVKAAPDGYTVLLSANAQATNTTLFPNASFNALRVFAPVAYIAYAPTMLAVPAALPARSLKDLIVMTKQQPGKLNYTSAGNGNSQHLGGEMLKISAHIDALHVP